MKGFTLIEILLSLSVVAILFAISVPIFQQLQSQNNVDVLVTTIAQDMRRAQLRSQAIDGSAPWGIHISSTTVTLFRGTSYALRAQAYDEVYDFTSDAAPSGLLDVVFSMLSGDPQSTGTTSISIASGLVRTINLNAKGNVTY